LRRARRQGFGRRGRTLQRSVILLIYVFHAKTQRRKVFFLASLRLCEQNLAE